MDQAELSIDYKVVFGFLDEVGTRWNGTSFGHISVFGCLNRTNQSKMELYRF
uniref:Uncharacterized protein n=1 Tax=Arundo donax TaxID=35708 RepID=A0A0A8ZC56_ARUDO